MFTQFDQGLQWYDARINVRSTTAQELTRLTLLFKFQTTQGSRHATVYIPKLAPTGGGQFDPIALSWMYLNDPPKDIPKDLVAMNLDNTRVHCSIWCDQFRAEGLELTALSREELVNDINLLSLQPGLVYSSEGGQVLNPNEEAPKAPPQRGDTVLGGGGKSTIAPYKLEYEPDGRFELICKKLTPVKRDYEVELELTDHTADPAKSKPQLLRGIVTLPTVTFDNAGHMISTEECRLKLMAGKQEFQMILVGQWRDGEWRWQAGKDLTTSRRYNPDTIPVSGSPDAVANERLRAAMVLFCMHKYTEAQQAYEKISVDYPPDSRWNILARRCISFLKEIDRTSDKSQQARAEAMQKMLDVRRGKTTQAPEEADKKTDRPIMKGRPSVAKSNDPPPRSTPDQPTRASSPKDAAFNRDESAKPATGKTAAATRVTVDDVEYEYLGLVRQGAKAIVTVRATSNKGDRAGTQGQITFTDDQGEKYYGTVEDPSLQLREGKPVKLTWRFGTNAFTGKSTAPPPKITRFTLVSIVILVGGSNPTIEFSDVPATVGKR